LETGTGYIGGDGEIQPEDWDTFDHRIILEKEDAIFGNKWPSKIRAV
jgi:hypothetical protein